MSKIQINYDDLGEQGASYRSKLESLESAVRRGIAGIARTDWVRWRCGTVANGNLVFRLVSYSNPDDCIAQFFPLDLTLDADEFAKLILEGQRPCT